MSTNRVFKCPACIKRKKSGILQKKKNCLICKKCNAFYPYYKGLPVLLTIEDDFYHLKKALSPAKYRVFKYGN